MACIPRAIEYVACVVVLALLFPVQGQAAETTVVAPPPSSSGAVPLDVTAERIDYLQDQEIYEADGSVVVNQGSLHLTADHLTIQALPGVMIATGHARLIDPKGDLTADRLELNINTEAGVVTHGQLYVKASNTFIDGRLMQRFSEDHYRIKEGRFTNCDAEAGETPAWRFHFKDLDLNTGNNVAFKGGWLCVLDVPIVPLPTMTYPLSPRSSGFLIPTIGYDNRFGWHAQESLYWAINPSQDLTIAPSYYANLGYGSDVEYRYVLNRQSRGQWFVSYLQQTQLPNVSGVSSTQEAKQARGLISGSHTQLFTPDLLLRVQANLVSDANYFQQLSNSGAQRALPSSENNLLATQRMPYGNLYLQGQYLQPLQSGGPNTFQRLPEVGYTMPNSFVFNSPFLLGVDTNYVNFYRDQGFVQNRIDFVPGVSTDVIDFGHMVGATPQFKFREVYYTHGVTEASSQRRETMWAGMDLTSKLSRRYIGEEGPAVLHTIEPGVTYEYVPSTNQSQIPQIDQVDDLPKKNLLTYLVKSRVLEQDGHTSFNWLDLIVAQSYHVDGVQTQARDFTPGVQPLVGTTTQPLQPATVPINGKRLSDVWMRAVIGNNLPQFVPVSVAGSAYGQSAGTMAVPAQKPIINQFLTVDTFVSPYTASLTQFNTDFRVQQGNNWYMEVGQRYSTAGNRPRRGDIWNPISFNEVFAPTQEIQFVTAGGAFRTPWGWTLGGKAYYDVKNGRSPEYDLVGLYQNPCKCWSLGLYYLQFPDRAQYNFMLSLTGVGWNENFGTAVLRSILSPLLYGEKGLPWAAPGGPYGRPQGTLPLPGAGIH
jgi:LPS-assembly protein